MIGNYRWVICALLFFATTINYIDRQILSLLKEILDKDIGWTNAQFGAVNSAFQFAYGIGLLGFGWFVDRFGTKIPGWKTDRGRIYIMYGPPDEIESHPSGGKYNRPADEGGGTTETFPFEQWRYRYIEGIGKNVIMEFVDTTRTGDYRMTMDPKEKAVRPVPEQQDVVFSSVGPGEKAVVVVWADRNLRVTLPIDYDATRFSTVVTSLQGKTIWRTGAPLTDPCEGKAEDSGCRSNYLHTVTQPPLPTGSYVMTAVVTDSSTWTDKTYVVNFSVH